MRLIRILFVSLFLALPTFASVTTLTPSNGGTGCNLGAGSVGQIPISDGTKFCPADPIVSYNVVTLISAQSATGTVVGTAQRISTLSASGTLTVTYAGITGSPASCTLQVKNVDFLGNSLNDGSAVVLAPANGTSAQKFTPTAGMESSDQISATYACGTYPTAGTISVEFTPAHTVFLSGPIVLGAGSAIVGKVTTDQTTHGTTDLVAADVTKVGGSAIQTGTGTGGAGIPRVTVSNDSTVGLVAGSSIVGKVGIDQTTPGTTNGVQVNAALPSGTNLLGKAGFDGTTPGSTNGVTQFQPARITGTITSAASVVSTTVTGYGVAWITFNGTYAGVTVNFEQSDDGGTTWYTTTCTRSDTSLQENSEALTSNATRSFGCAVWAATNVRIRASAWTSGTANVGITLSAAAVEPAQTVGVAGSDANGRPVVKVYPDTTTTSYRASKKFAASSTTDNAVMPGNATNTVLVTKILLTCSQTTAGQINVELLKRSTADTAGTSAAMTAIPMDSNYAAAVSAPLSYTGTGPTVGTPIGDLDNLQVGCMAPGTATPNDIFIFHPDKPIILRGTAQQIAVNVGNAALTGGNITVTFEWEETTTP